MIGTKHNNLLITGCTGSVGRALISLSLEEGYRVTALVRPGSLRNRELEGIEGLTLLETSMDSYPDLGWKDLGKMDAVVHMAWAGTTGKDREDAGLQLKNVDATLEMIRLSARLGAQVFVGTGSQAEYGRKEEPLTPELSVSPESGYGIAKFAAGKLGRLLASSLGIRFQWLRLLSVYGPEDKPESLISYVTRCFMEGKSPSLTPCTQVWDYLYSRDAAAAILACVEKGQDGRTYVAGSGERRTLRDYVEEIRRITDSEALPGYGEKPFYPHQPRFLSADISSLTRDTGWTPRVPFGEGIREVQKKLAK